MTDFIGLSDHSRMSLAREDDICDILSPSDIRLLLGQISELKEGLKMFSPHSIGYRQSLSHDKLQEAWDNAVKLTGEQ